MPQPWPKKDTYLYLRRFFSDALKPATTLALSSLSSQAASKADLRPLPSWWNLGYINKMLERTESIEKMWKLAAVEHEINVGAKGNNSNQDSALRRLFCLAIFSLSFGLRLLRRLRLLCLLWWALFGFTFWLGLGLCLSLSLFCVFLLLGFSFHRILLWIVFGAIIRTRRVLRIRFGHKVTWIIIIFHSKDNEITNAIKMWMWSWSFKTSQKPSSINTDALKFETSKPSKHVLAAACPKQNRIVLRKQWKWIYECSWRSFFLADSARFHAANCSLAYGCTILHFSVDGFSSKTSLGRGDGVTKSWSWQRR